MTAQIFPFHHSPLKEQAISVLKTEAEAISALSSVIDETFEKAVALISIVKGRVIVSGMGKCSYIAQKIAATFASTGQPSFFVHPAEASHGDLGMITADDVVIMLSNSGETAELANLISYTHRFSIPLIAIVGRRQSTLAKMATAALVLPTVEEACPMGLAPTTSTTMMLALGDALAICLLKEKGFTASDFKIFHPGGNLGNQLVKVSEKMHTQDYLPLMSAGSSMKDALLVMTAKGFGCVGVIDPNQNDTLLGIITDGDLRRHMAEDLLSYQVEDVMTKNPTTISPDLLMAEALNIMNMANNQKGITSLFIINSHHKPIGLIHIHDFLRAGII